MSKRFSSALLALFLGLPLTFPLAAADTAPAAPAKPPATEIPDAVERPMLWKIEGGDLKKPSYLFGTIHLSDKRVTTLHSLAQDAYDHADAVYTEVSMDMKTQIEMTMALMRQDGRKLDDIVGADVAADLNAQLAAVNPQMNSGIFQTFKVWGVAIVVATLEDQLKGGEPLDKQLWDKAQAGGKKVGALETVKGHVGAMDTLSDEEQTLMLKGSLKAMKESKEKKENPNDKLLAIYLRGDESEIKKLEDAELADATGEEKALSGKINKILLVDRNARMASKMEKSLKAHPDQSHFFAAGTAHFSGDDRIQKFLEKAGYTVTRVEPAARPEAKPKPETPPAAPPVKRAA